MTAPQAFLSALAGLALCLSSEAHPNPQNAMWVQFEPSQIHLAIDVSLKELSAAWGFPTEEGGNADPAPFLWAAQQHQAYILDHLVISAGTRTLSGVITNLTPPAKMGDPEKTFFQYEIKYPLQGPPPKELWFYQDMLKEWPYAPDTPWDISYIVRAKRSGLDTVSSWLLGSGKSMELLTGWEAPSSPQTSDATKATSDKEASFFKKICRDLKGLLGL